MEDFETENRTLRSALRAVAAGDESMNTAPVVEARLLEEVRQIRRARRRRARIAWLAVAAAIALAILIPAWRTPIRTPDSTTAVQPVLDQTAAGGEVFTDFFPLAYGNVPAPDGHVIRLQVPRTALATFGVASFGSAGDVSSTVLADIVVGNDGLARAVRFVRMARDDEQQERHR